MNTDRKDQPHAERIEPIADLAARIETLRDAEQVRGGFNPQPEPPKTGGPVFRPPIFNPPPGLAR